MARLTLLFVLPLLGSAPADVSRETFFELKVRPVLATDCLPCHGGKKTSSGLKVDSRAALLKGGDRGPAIAPGDPDGSLLVQAIRRTHDEVKMPPEPKKRLSDEVISAFAKWVADGAVWPAGQARTLGSQLSPMPRYWAFEQVKVVEPPPGSSRS